MALRSRFRTCLVQAFGSSVSGLGFRGSDLDLYTYIDSEDPGCRLEHNADAKNKMLAAARGLYRLPHLCDNIVRIPRARVPIVKFSVPRLDDLKCDMSFGDPMSCQNSRLIGWLMKAGQCGDDGGGGGGGGGAGAGEGGSHCVRRPKHVWVWSGKGR